MQAKVSAWRDPKDRPQRLAGTPQQQQAQANGPHYEGPDQELAAQLERQVQITPYCGFDCSCESALSSCPRAPHSSVIALILH